MNIKRASSLVNVGTSQVHARIQVQLHLQGTGTTTWYGVATNGLPWTNGLPSGVTRTKTDAIDGIMHQLGFRSMDNLREGMRMLSEKLQTTKAASGTPQVLLGTFKQELVGWGFMEAILAAFGKEKGKPRKG
jgi:hypothetical protein